MRPTGLFRILLWTQGIYTLITAIWALIDIESFMAVSGPKTDIWLVKTVSVCLVAIASCFLAHLLFPGPKVPVIILGILTSAGLAFIDFYYTANDTIKWVYALDGGVEMVFLSLWIYLLGKHKR